MLIWKYQWEVLNGCYDLTQKAISDISYNDFAIGFC